jgi:prephenate dehydratase
MPDRVAADTVYKRVCTLGDKSEQTCSMDAVRGWGKGLEIVPCETFEAAAQATKSFESDAFVVPAAYPRVNHFIMDQGLEVAEVFIRAIPALVVVGKRELSDSADILFHHPATAPLIGELACVPRKCIEVSSNVRACEAAVENEASIAITNSLSAEYYQIPVRQVLREGIKMPWLCFVRKHSPSSS